MWVIPHPSLLPVLLNHSLRPILWCPTHMGARVHCKCMPLFMGEKCQIDAKCEWFHIPPSRPPFLPPSRYSWTVPSGLLQCLVTLFICSPDHKRSYNVLNPIQMFKVAILHMKSHQIHNEIDWCSLFDHVLQSRYRLCKRPTMPEWWSNVS